MHPIMSDIDISIRQFEKTMERNALQHQILVTRVARQRGLPGLSTRLAHRVWQFIDPRGFALAQYRRTEQAQVPVETRIEPTVTVTPTPALMHAFPIAETSDTPAWRKAA